MLSGVACAIPGIYAARAIDSPRKRLLTYMAIPLMPCSARLPVYTLLIAAFILRHRPRGWWDGRDWPCSAFIFRHVLRAAGNGADIAHQQGSLHRPAVCAGTAALPGSRPGPILRNAWNRSKHFVTKAGKIIFTVTVVIWVLGYFPTSVPTWVLLAGLLGRAVEPLFAPLGLDWRYAVAILTSFLAREVFVGTLGTIFGIEAADENMTPLVQQIQASDLALGPVWRCWCFRHCPAVRIHRRHPVQGERVRVWR